MGKEQKTIKKDFVLEVDFRLSYQMELWIKFPKYRLKPDIKSIQSEIIQSPEYLTLLVLLRAEHTRNSYFANIFLSQLIREILIPNLV